jgi:hypothetical protein
VALVLLLAPKLRWLRQSHQQQSICLFFSSLVYAENLFLSAKEAMPMFPGQLGSLSDASTAKLVMGAHGPPSVASP